jgi:glycosyltransferase involved in cell wall biosynthesis
MAFMTPELAPVTVVIPTLNESDRLPACLAALRWAREVIVADAGSTDATVQIAQSMGARVLHATGLTIGAQRNLAIEAATQPWILAIDADERVSPELARAITTAVAAPAVDAYRVLMRNRYLGAPMERGGWGSDWHTRLFKSHLRYHVKRVHESLNYSGATRDLSGHVDHDSYRDLRHQLEKVTRYSVWGANDLQTKIGNVGVSHLFFRPLVRFVKSYLLQGAFLEGRRGLVLSVVHAWSAFAKYALLWDLQRKRDEAPHINAEDASHTPVTRVTEPSSIAPNG